MLELFKKRKKKFAFLFLVAAGCMVIFSACQRKGCPGQFGSENDVKTNIKTHNA